MKTVVLGKNQSQQKFFDVLKDVYGNRASAQANITNRAKNLWIILATTQIMNDTLALSKPKRFRTDRKFNTGDANAIVFVLMNLFLNRKIL